ncbi:MAG: hypothetical protein IKD42_03375 [Kiritimatiellae bacterium]|nr:hypothetical protein [Kiritimatiellia bacterium]
MACERYFLQAAGIVSALGVNTVETAARLSQGDVSGMKKLSGLCDGDETYFGFASGFPAPCTLEAENPQRETPRVGRLLDAALAQISAEIDEAAGIFGEDRVGSVIGTSNSTMEEFTDDPVVIDMSYPARHVREVSRAKGPSFAVSTACSSSAKAFAAARRLISSGRCDAVVVGGADAYTRTVIEGFHSLEALSSGLSKPMSPDRDGINLGEAAAVFLMRRDVPGRFKGGNCVFLAGVGESSDAYHLTAPDPSGRGAEEAMRRALADAGLSPRDIDFINLHGTGTRYNDSMECDAVMRVFGRREAEEGGFLTDALAVRAFSTKRMTGHTLGAAGAVEAVLTWLELGRKPGAALSNSFAFGGSNASLAFVSAVV